MLTPERMGVLALAILWVNALLVAAATFKQIRDLLARRAALAGAARGRVVRGAGPGGALAVQRVEQVGRADGDGAIVFHDRSAAGEVFGGALALDGGGALEIPASATAEVWLDCASQANAFPGAGEFDRGYVGASKARGLVRTVAAIVEEGATVYVARAADGGVSLVSTVDPRALLGRRAALGLVFVAGEILAASACTAVALHAPVFGAVSTLGGVMGLAFFLLVQPAGVAVRDALLVPARAPVRGRWVRGAAEAQPD